MGHWTETVFRENPEVFRQHLEDEIEAASGEVEDLLGLLADHGIDPETVLDVPCGIGRHSVELAERDRSVRGIDISESYLHRARERASERGVADSVTFERADMRDLADRTDAYDIVLNAWTSFGYYDEETDRDVLRGMYDRTAQGGATVLELVNREGLLAEFRPAHVPPDEDRLLVESHEYDPATARIETERRVFDETDDGYEFAGEMTYEVRLYAPVELADLCRSVGFSEVSLYADLDGSPLERDSSRLAVVAEP